MNDSRVRGAVLLCVGFLLGGLARKCERIFYWSIIGTLLVLCFTSFAFNASFLGGMVLGVTLAATLAVAVYERIS